MKWGLDFLSSHNCRPGSRAPGDVQLPFLVGLICGVQATRVVTGLLMGMVRNVLDELHCGVNAGTDSSDCRAGVAFSLAARRLSLMSAF